LCAEEAAAQEQTGQVEECLKVNLLKIKTEMCKKVTEISWTCSERHPIQQKLAIFPDHSPGHVLASVKQISLPISVLACSNSIWLQFARENCADSSSFAIPGLDPFLITVAKVSCY